MSSFYDDSSLVVIPSGYKTSKIYAEKPTDGSGDLTFTRASGATRVGPNGLIEKVRTNLLLQSQNFAAAAWSLNGTITRTANYGTAPDGTQTSTRIQWSGSSTFELYQYTGVAAPVYGSVYIKGTAGQTIKYSGNSVTLNGSWQRIEGALAIDGSNTFFSIIGSTGVNTALDFQLWGAQGEVGDIATAYIPTTTAAVSVGPVSNVPRLDYLGSSCPRLLLEPQRTNIVPYSEQLNNAAWTKLETNITANDAVSPEGYTNADKFIANTNNAAHVIYQSVASGTYTFSIYAKAAGENVFSMWLNDFSKRAVFDLSSGTVTTSNVTSSSITSVGNGWYRCTVYDTSTTSFVAIYGRNAEAYVGNGTNGFLFWGAQCEAGAYATSYIPTLGASVTRVADAASKTGISSLIGQTEGTLFVDFNYLGNIGATASIEAIPLYVGAGAFTDAIYFTVFQANLYLVVWVGSVNQVTLNLGSISAGKHKASLSYIANDFKVYFDGVLAGTDTSGSIPSLSAVYFGTAGTSTTPEAISVNQALVFKTRLTNAQQAELTTL
jgi:hypothetical protein